ncbi:MAG: hypothetical protein AB9891_12890 [Anaerolineaceae bacterium]
MLPDPKDVASGIKHLFRSKEEKQNAVELQRDLKLVEGKNRIRAYIAHQQQMIPRLRGLAKRALAMGDEARFQQIGKQLIWTENDIVRWEKYSLTLDMLESRRDQVRASTDLISTVKVMTDSMTDLAGTEQVNQLQGQLDKSLAQASAMDEGITKMMEGMDAALAQSIPADEKSLEKLRDSLGEEIVSQGSSPLDKEIETGLNNLRSQLNSDLEK